MDFPGKEKKQLSLPSVWFPCPSADKPDGWCWLAIILQSMQEAKGKWPLSIQIIKLATATFHCWWLTYICLFPPCKILKFLKYIEELKTDSNNLFSCRCFMKICCKIMWMTHMNVCRGKHRFSMLSTFAENNVSLTARWVVTSQKGIQRADKTLNNLNVKHDHLQLPNFLL